MKNHQSRDLSQSPPKGVNSINFNVMETDFNSEIIPLSLDIIFLATPALIQEISVVVLQQQRQKKRVKYSGSTVLHFAKNIMRLFRKISAHCLHLSSGNIISHCKRNWVFPCSH